MHAGISFTTKFLNQAGALVHVYTDGSVLVTHGGGAFMSISDVL